MVHKKVLPYQEGNGRGSTTNGGRSEVMQAGFSEDMLGLWSVASFGRSVYDEARAYVITKNSREIWRAYEHIRNPVGAFAKQQAKLLSNLSQNLDMLEVAKAGSKRFALFGLTVGFADMRNKGYTTEAVGLYTADAIMTGVAFLGPVGAGAAAIYFTGRFAYDLYQMTQDGE